MNIKEFCDRVDNALVRVSRNEREEIRRELSDHLEDSVCTLVEAGYSEEDATELAVNSMGEPEEVGKQFQRAYSAVWLWVYRLIIIPTIVSVMYILKGLWFLLAKENDLIDLYRFFIWDMFKVVVIAIVVAIFIVNIVAPKNHKNRNRKIKSFICVVLLCCSFLLCGELNGVFCLSPKQAVKHSMKITKYFSSVGVYDNLEYVACVDGKEPLYIYKNEQSTVIFQTYLTILGWQANFEWLANQPEETDVTLNSNNYDGIYGNKTYFYGYIFNDDVKTLKISCSKYNDYSNNLKDNKDKKLLQEFDLANEYDNFYTFKIDGNILYYDIVDKEGYGNWTVKYAVGYDANAKWVCEAHKYY